MIRRFFNVLIWICGAWIALLMFNWGGVSHVLGWPIVLILMAAPMTLVLALYYISGI